MSILPNSALIVIDMQNDFLDSKGALYLARQSEYPQLLTMAINRAANMITNFKILEYPIYVLKDTHYPEDKEFITIASHCIKNSWGHELHPTIKKALEGSQSVSINKFEFDGSNEFFQFITHKRIITDIYLVGVAFDICVFHTAVGLTKKYLGKQIHIVKPATYPSNFLWDVVTQEMLTDLFGIDIIYS
jgi:nicotinamidase-related amidase